MKDPKSVFDTLKARGSEVFAQVSAELMESPHFVKALQGAMRGKEKLDQGVGRVLKNMNIPTRTEFKRALGRIEALERELAELKARAAAKPRRQPAREAKAKS